METEVVPILRVADADAAVRWYERLGFTKQWEHRSDPDCPAFVSMARGGARLFLSEHRGDARPDTLVGLMMSDVDAVEAEFGRPAGDPPYGCEFELRDPDGDRLRISKPAN
jgi:catechol 2,3-dioxygenase-like lactoylglutathione lyase family enzyme